MQIKTRFKKIITLSIFITITSCSSDSELWQKYKKLNNGTTLTSSKLHDKYFKMNDNKDSNFTYSSSYPTIK